MRIGEIRVDYSNAAVSIDQVARAGSTLAIRGIQPQPGGLVLGSCIALLRDGSLGTGRAEGSLGHRQGEPARWALVVPVAHLVRAELMAHWVLAAPRVHLGPAR